MANANYARNGDSLPLGFSISRKTRNKEFTGDISEGWEWHSKSLTKLMEAVHKGWAINPAKFTGTKREDAAFRQSQLVILDIDNKKKVDGKAVYDPQLTIEQALAISFVQRHCIYAYTSPSHTPEWHKFRLIFCLSNSVDDIAIAKRIIRHVGSNIAGCDRSAMSGTNIFFGNTNAIDLIVNPHAEAIDLGEILTIFAKEDEESAAVMAEQKKAREQRLKSTKFDKDPVSQARHYLSFISPNRADSYSNWIAVGMALKSVSDELFVDWADWSSRHGAFQGESDCYKHWRGASFGRGDAEYELGKLGKWSLEDGREKVVSITATKSRKSDRKMLERTFDADSADDYEAPQSGKKPAARRIYEGLKPEYGAIVAWNELTQRVELRKGEIDLAELRAEVAINGNGTNPSPQEDFFLAMTYMAKENSYHPIKEYLKACKDAHGQDLDRDSCVAIFDQLLLDCLNVEATEMHRIFIKRFLINAVARVLEPGFKVDTVLVLQGRQGSKKSTFCKMLCQDPSWFTDSLSDIEHKDAFSLIRNRWIVELAELERFTHGKNSDGVFKVFLSKADDDYRQTYGREIISVARSCVFVGTVNRVDFLKDPTGSRRFHIIADVNAVNTEWLVQWKDLVWACAVFMYGIEPKPTIEEEEILKKVSEMNSLFEADSSWEIAVSQYLQQFNDSVITTKSVLVDCLKFSLADIRKPHEMEVADIMTRLGWKKTRQRLPNGGIHPVKCWQSPNH